MSVNANKGMLPSLAKFSPTLILSGIVIIVSICLYANAELEASRANEKLLPVPGWKVFVRKARQFHQKYGRVPETAEELFRQTGEPAANISSDGRAVQAGNYFYYYSKLDSNVVGLWAIPYGPRANEASAYYVTVAVPQGERVWKGPAFERGDADRSSFSPNPTVQQLAVLGMTEQMAEKIRK